MADSALFRSRFGRRAALRGTALGATGLAAAALLGCGGDGDSGGSGGGGASGANTGDLGIPKNVKRAPGLNAAIGTAAINEKRVIQGGTYRRSDSGTARQEDPDISISGAVAEMNLDRLFTANGWTMEITPDMLASYEILSDLEMVFKLRPGIKTHPIPPANGRVFNAEDVVYGLMRKAGKLDPDEAFSKYARVGQFIGMDKAEAVDDVTVKVTFTTPNGSILNALADPRANMPTREMEDIGWKDPIKTNGTGAWIHTQHVEGARKVFKRFEDYYRTWDEGGRPGYDTFEMVVLPDRAANLAAYISGQIHEFGGIRPEEEKQIASSAGDSLMYLEPGPTWDHFAVNLRNPMFQDGRIRNAFQRALDYKALNEPLGKGWTYSSVLHNMFPESWSHEEISKMPGYNQANKQQDIAEAVKLMDAAGHPRGRGLVFKQVNNGTQVNDNNVRIKGQFEKIWPEMKITLQTITDYGSATNILNEGQFEARVWNHTSVPDVAVEAVTYHHTIGGRNYQGYSQKWADEVLEKAVQTPGSAERKALIVPFQKRYFDEGPAIIMLRTPAINKAVQGNVGGHDLLTGPWAYSGYRTSLRWFWQTEK
jgi:peptide/nickel transport system substrate-binding protein